MAKKQQSSGAILCKCSACSSVASAPSGSRHRWLGGASATANNGVRAKRKRCRGTWEPK